ncbi:MAG TPA: DinB family protein [Pyrinomonadaceae bacterium]
MDEITREFLTVARKYLREDYLPKIERCLERLTDEQVWWRAHETSNSIGNLLLHLEGNARQWILCGVGGARDARVRQREFDERAQLPRAVLVEKLRATLDEVDGVLASLTAREFDGGRRSIQGNDVSVLEAVFHVVEHFSMHTGQIILLTKTLTASDLAFYDTSGGDPRPDWRRATPDDD